MDSEAISHSAVLFTYGEHGSVPRTVEMDRKLEGEEVCL